MSLPPIIPNYNATITPAFEDEISVEEALILHKLVKQELKTDSKKKKKLRALAKKLERTIFHANRIYYNSEQLRSMHNWLEKTFKNQNK